MTYKGNIKGMLRKYKGIVGTLFVIASAISNILFLTLFLAKLIFWTWSSIDIMFGICVFIF